MWWCIYLQLVQCYFVTFSGNFNCIVCLIVAFVFLLGELRALRELPWVALITWQWFGASIVTLWRKNLKRLVLTKVATKKRKGEDVTRRMVTFGAIKTSWHRWGPLGGGSGVSWDCQRLIPIKAERTQILPNHTISQGKPLYGKVQ